jgi:hypothetical protein
MSACDHGHGGGGGAGHSLSRARCQGTVHAWVTDARIGNLAALALAAAVVLVDGGTERERMCNWQLRRPRGPRRESSWGRGRTSDEYLAASSSSTARSTPTSSACMACEGGQGSVIEPENSGKRKREAPERGCGRYKKKEGSG